MLGPLPRLHQLVVAAVVILALTTVGAWSALATPLPTSLGAVLGALTGLGVAHRLLHDPHEPRRPRQARTRRH